ncbi:MAG: hypothetical protein WC501_01080 [Candidatus Micrarchaeia archaeon]
MACLFSTYSNSYFPGGVDTSTHLFQTWLFYNEGFTAWNHWWYAGNPQLEQYPPATHIIPSLLVPLFGLELSYKIIFSILFLCLPLTFYLFIKDFNFREEQKLVSLYFFSFSIVFIHYLQGGTYSSLVSIPFVLLFFKYSLLFLKNLNFKYLSIASISLALTALSHLFIPIGAGLLFSIYLFCFFRDLRFFKRFFAILALGGILVSFFWIPFYFNYSMTEALSDLNYLNFIKEVPLFPIEMCFRSLFSYINIISILGIFIFLIILIYCACHYYKNSQKNNILFLILIFIIPLILYIFLPNPYPGIIKGKLPLIYPIFFSIIIGSIFKIDKKIDCLIILLISLMFISFILHPQAFIPHEIIDIASWASNNTEHRALFLPQGFGLLTYDEPRPNTYEYLYEVYILPACFGKEVYNGWFGEMAPHSKKDEKILFSCLSPKSYEEIFKDSLSSWESITTKRSNCVLDTNPDEFCSIVQNSGIDTIFANTFFPEVVDYINSANCFEKAGSFGPLLAYKVLDSKPYVDRNLSYEKKSGRIKILINESINQTIIVRESYYPYWKAYLDSKEINISENDGFMAIPISVEKEEHILELNYKSQKFYGIFDILSILGWFIALLLILKPSILSFLVKYLN